MNVSELTPSVQDKVLFSLKERHRLPSSPGVYSLITLSGDILYIGLTGNLRQRFCDHLDDPKKRVRTSLGRVMWFAYREVETAGLEAYERGWLNLFEYQHAELPFFNTNHAPVI